MRHSQLITKTTALTLGFIILLFAAMPSVALAGPTTGELLEQMEALQKQVNALKSRSYVSQFLSLSKYEECEVNEFGLDCEGYSTILLSIYEGQEISLEVACERYISQNGEPVFEEYTYTVSMVKLSNTPSDPNYTETVQDFVVQGTVVAGDESIVFEISPADPLYSLQDDPAYEGWLKIKASLVTDSLVAFSGSDIVSVKEIKTESTGAIIEASIEPYCQFDTEATLNVHIGNFGDLSSDYITTVTQTDPDIAPVTAQFNTSEPYTEVELEFTLTTTGTFDSSQSCLVTLKSTTGRIYDELVVNFGEPIPDCPEELNYIPDFDGDGDVDLVDFCEFASYYLIGT